jgi:hypothetical protein
MALSAEAEKYFGIGGGVVGNHSRLIAIENNATAADV